MGGGGRGSCEVAGSGMFREGLGYNMQREMFWNTVFKYTPGISLERTAVVNFPSLVAC